MYVTNTKPEYIESGLGTKTTSMYKRQYPAFRTVRIRNVNLEKIKGRTVKYGESVDDVLTRLLTQLEYYERLGYPTQEESQSF